MPVFEKTRPFMASSEQGTFTILGIPLDLTTSYRPGTRFAPSAVREASYGLEEYDLLSGRNLCEVKFSDIGDLILPGAVQDAVREVKKAIEGLLDMEKVPLLIGGEHLLTYPVVDSLRERSEDLYIVVLDAHADMREQYSGLRLSHATVLRRISEIIPPNRIFQFGIRSGSKEEADYYRLTGMSYSSGFPEDGFFNTIKGKNVYLSIDIDVIDPGHAPGTGTPEPCGWGPEDVLLFIRKLEGVRLCGFDIVEVSPPFDPSGITAILAAKIIREVLLYLT